MVVEGEPGPAVFSIDSKLVDKFVADAWEEGARWAGMHGYYTEEEIQKELDDNNPYKKKSGGE